MAKDNIQPSAPVSIHKHRLAASDTVHHLPCPKNTQPFADGQPDTLVIHYTAGRNGKNSAEYLARDNVKASAHVVIDRSGEIYQLVPFNIISWHAGKSSYGGRSGYNRFSIGIELDNAGVLERVGDHFESWFKGVYPAEQVLHATHRNERQPAYWHTYTEAQIETVQQLCTALVAAYPTLRHLLGHEEISPNRKRDPGPAFPLDKLRSLLFESREEDLSDEQPPPEQTMAGAEGYVDAGSLNIRQGPSPGSDPIAPPLARGTKVIIKDRRQGWYQVTTEIEGWVSGKYIRAAESRG